MSNKVATQKEIAERIGVSVATVSRALNDQPGVSSEMRARILGAASDMGYAPTMSARSLATSVTQTVAFVVHKKDFVHYILWDFIIRLLKRLLRIICGHNNYDFLTVKHIFAFAEWPILYTFSL